MPDGFEEAFSSGSAVALGYFDGVHLGHRKLFSLLRGLAEETGVVAVAHTFSNTPKSKIFATGGDGLITTLAERCALIHKAGVENVAVFPFTDSLAAMKAGDFLEEYVSRILNAKVVLAGEDYHFGANREGDSEFLTRWAEGKGIRPVLVPPELFNDRVISSSWIRERILSGDMITAHELLGRPVSYEGEVMRGRGLGGTLGFPTANIGIPSGKVIPDFGVYTSFLRFEDNYYPAVSNIGLRPTVSDNEVYPLLETTALGVKLELYGKRITVYPIGQLRKEKRFESIEELRIQVMKDVDEARAYHGSHPDYSNIFKDVL
ncbi:MAG: riboflavin biosynthesis protein RibF [Clostridiaceae bacterium]|nr:riboflavin biosynthesis protein RibF [Oscillospiraceae bacterium]NLO62777.1 riboflavin biosynthesis protein RibF [Clostridiaceae bacterium]